MEDVTPTLQEVVTTDTELKEWLVNFVGESHNPDNGEVTVAMIVDTVAQQFPEFLMAVAEENWVRGYHQALDDVDAGRTAIEQENV
jgi:hypothetical protein|tara:strand:+ start:748 stop:1005 length:258 start_codon:yes stop_codon:yes gene_type:complete